MRKFHAEEIRTYLEPKSAPYELDHVFTDAETSVGLVACEVLNNIVVHKRGGEGVSMFRRNHFKETVAHLPKPQCQA